MNAINKAVGEICRKFCNGMEMCPEDGFCSYAAEIRKNIIKIIVTSHDETDD